MFSKTPAQRGSPPGVPSALHRRDGVGPARRPSAPAADRKPPAEALAALVTGAALFLAAATAVVLIKDSRSGPSTAMAPVPAEAPAPPPAAPPAVEPRFPADQQEQPVAQEEAKAQRDATPYPAPVAPSLDLLGPAPVDMRFAVYLASFSSEEQAHAGWEILERRYRRPLSGLSPLVRRGKSKQGAAVFELFAGPFDSLVDAGQRCAALSIATANCKPADLSKSAEGAGSWD
jgi:SPOR domain